MLLPKKLILFLIGSLILLQGCSHYHWGNPGAEALPFTSIYVKPVDNKSFAPQAHTLLTEQVIRLLHQSALPSTAHPNQADASLSITLTDYSQSKATTLDNDTQLASSFFVTLTACVSLQDNCTGQFYFKDRHVTATVTGRSDVSLQSVMYQDMPLLTRNLSNSIRNLVIDTW